MRLSRLFYSAARRTRDAECVLDAIDQGSATPILRRIVNKIIGRYLVSRLWWK